MCLWYWATSSPLKIPYIYISNSWSQRIDEKPPTQPGEMWYFWCFAGWINVPHNSLTIQAFGKGSLKLKAWYPYSCRCFAKRSDLATEARICWKAAESDLICLLLLLAESYLVYPTIDPQTHLPKKSRPWWPRWVGFVRFLIKKIHEMFLKHRFYLA